MDRSRENRKRQSVSLRQSMGQFVTTCRRCTKSQCHCETACQERRSQSNGVLYGLRSGYLTEAANRGIPSPKPWSNPAIARCSRHPIIITTPKGVVSARRGCFKVYAKRDCITRARTFNWVTLSISNVFIVIWNVADSNDCGLWSIFVNVEIANVFYHRRMTLQYIKLNRDNYNGAIWSWHHQVS